jgi:Holliday junction resolvase RusA-like endonuclease
MSETFTFHGKPVPKPRMTRADAWKKRPIVEDYWAFKDEIRRQVNESDFKIGEAHEVVFFIPMPKSWSKKKKEEMMLEPHRQRPDLDNLLKALWDSLLDEDSACHMVKAKKIWDVTPKIWVRNLEL